MIEANFTNYNIDLADIWDFERELFLNNQNSEEKASELINKIQIEIIKKTEPLFDNSYADNNEDNCDYYKRNIDQYLKARNSIKTLFQIDFFFNNDKCYEYNTPIVIEKHNHDFDYWFALKINQYQLNLQELENFLNFQLNNNFENDKNKFEKFLTLLIRQYEGLSFSKNLITTINEWKEQKIEVDKKKSRTIKGNLITLKHIKLVNNPKYLDSNNLRFYNFFQSLKKNNFIDESTELEQFKNIFKNEKINPKNRIKWISNNIILKWFIDGMLKKQKITEIHKHDKWLITISCFINKKKDIEKEFSTNQLRNSSACKNDLNKKKILDEIIEKI